MRIGGLVEFSLCDYPGRVSAVVFTQGCNFRCPFCHNGELIPIKGSDDDLISRGRILEFLDSRRRLLDGVVISGGEPTLQRDLIDFLKQIRSLGYYIKLDTNGSRPRGLREVISQKLADYIAMDVKAPWIKYNRLSGCHVAVEHLKESMKLISQSGLSHEFRTTMVEPILSSRDKELIRNSIPYGSAHRFQTFRSEHALDPALQAARGPANGLPLAN